MFQHKRNKAHNEPDDDWRTKEGCGHSPSCDLKRKQTTSNADITRRAAKKQHGAGYSRASRTTRTNSSAFIVPSSHASPWSLRAVPLCGWSSLYVQRGHLGNAAGTSEAEAQQRCMHMLQFLEGRNTKWQLEGPDLWVKALC